MSTLVYILYPSSYLPLLLVPILFTQLALVSRSDHSPFSPPTLVFAITLSLLYSIAFFFLPWNIQYPLITAQRWNLVEICTLQTSLRDSQSMQKMYNTEADCRGNNGKNGYLVQGLITKAKDTVENGFCVSCNIMAS